MNYRVVNLAFAILLFVVAYLTFDSNDWTQLTVSFVLSLSGVNFLLLDSESPARRRLGRTCLRLAAVISVFLILKLLIFG